MKISSIRIHLNFVSPSPNAQKTCKTAWWKLNQWLQIECEFIRNGYYFEVVETFSHTDQKTSYTYNVYSKPIVAGEQEIEFIKFDLHLEFPSRIKAIKAAVEYIDTLSRNF